MKCRRRPHFFRVLVFSRYFHIFTLAVLLPPQIASLFKKVSHYLLHFLLYL